MELRRRILIAAVFAMILAGMMELIAVGAMVLVGPSLDIDTRTTRAIYREQSAAVSRLLDQYSVARTEIDPILGWRYRAGFADDEDEISMQGLRGARVYDTIPPTGTVRIAAFGDSFVYGTEVAPGETWAARVEALFPETEVLNYGVGGYGTDQAYLRFELEGSDLCPHIVVIGFHPVNLRRVVNVYRRFVSTNEAPLAKPRFIVTPDGQLELLPTPLPDSSAYERLLVAPRAVGAFGSYDRWFTPAVYRNPVYDWSASIRLTVAAGVRAYRRLLDPDRLIRGDTFSETSQAFALQLMIFERFIARAEAAGAQPLIVLFPDESSIRGAMQGRRTVYAPLADRIRQESWPLIDLVEGFLSDGNAADVGAWFAPGGHYSPQGNLVVARFLGDGIRKWTAAGDMTRAGVCERPPAAALQP